MSWFITILAVTPPTYIPHMFLLIMYPSGTGDPLVVECQHTHGQTSPWHISERSAIKTNNSWSQEEL